MRYIDKSNCCKEFDVYVITDKPQIWKDFKENIKLILHQHLYHEQGGLCIYCQQQLPPKLGKQFAAHIRSHIEHIRPRSEYNHLTFDYCNLSISCEGFDCEIEKSPKQPKKEFCEHRKEDRYDEENFLNPIEVKEIQDYFVYDLLELKISPNLSKNNKDKEKASHTITTLDLNHKSLVKMRSKVYRDYVKNKYPDLKYEKLPPFYSMLLQFGLL